MRMNRSVWVPCSALTVCVLATLGFGAGLRAEAQVVAQANGQVSAEVHEGVLTLGEAQARALERHPALRSAELEIEARDGGIRQARLLPNPDFEVEHEGFSGSGEFAGNQGSETSLVVSQPILTAGKRTKRASLALALREEAAWERDITRFDVLAEVTEAFVDVQAFQERLAVASEAAAIASRTWSIVAERVRAGKSPRVDEERMRVELAQAQLAEDLSASELEAARLRLASTWGGEPEFGRVAGGLRIDDRLPRLPEVLSSVDTTPELSLWDARLESREAGLALTRAERFPDIVIGGGIKYEQQPDDYGFKVGVSVPLPLFNRNQGSIREAKVRREQAAADMERVRINLRRDVSDTYLAVTRARRAAERLQSEVLPAAERLYQAVYDSYQMGKVGYLEVLESQRSLNSVRRSHLETLIDYRKSRIRLDRLAGMISTTNNREKTDE